MAIGAYIGVPKKAIVTGEQIEITGGNINEFFNVTNGQYYFEYSEDSSTECINNNPAGTALNISLGNGYYAETQLVALFDMEVSIRYGCFLKNAKEYFTIAVGGTSVVRVQTTSATTETYTVSIKQGDLVSLKYYGITKTAVYVGITVAKQEESTEGSTVEVARKIKCAYVGAITEVTNNVNITSENISNYFAVSNGSAHYFKCEGSTWTTTNGGKNSSIAITTLTALVDMDISFKYSYSSEANYDKFTLSVADTVVANELSGATTTKAYTGKLVAGQTVSFKYAKDGSGHNNDDKCTFSDLVVTLNYVDSIARKIKKAYIGIGGVARPCFGIHGITYYGKIEPLAAAAGHGAAVSLGDYALFGGGHSNNASITVYNKSLTKIINPTIKLQEARTDLSAAAVGNYAIFSNGYNKKYIDVFDSSLTEIIHDMQVRMSPYGVATSLENYALFTGGYDTSGYNKTVYHINKALTLSWCSESISASIKLGATTAGGYALFGGGYNSTSIVANVAAYSSSLVKVSSVANLSKARAGLVATAVENCAIFAGGYDSSSVYATTDVYGESLTKLSADTLSVARFYLSAVSNKNYALFAGGSNDEKGSTSASVYSFTNATGVVDAYNSSLVRTEVSQFTPRCIPAAAAIGDYILFGGGLVGTSDSSSIVEAYIL